MDFYLAQNGQRKGPLSLNQLVNSGVQPDTLVWHQGLAEWKRADEVPELCGIFQFPPPLPTPTPPPPPSPAAAAAARPVTVQKQPGWWHIGSGGIVVLIGIALRICWVWWHTRH